MANDKKTAAAGNTGAAKKPAGASAAKKPAGRGKDAAAAAPEAKAAAAKSASGGLRLKELVDHVSAGQTPAVKKSARALTEAVLARIAQALDQGEEVNLIGLGKFKRVKSAEKDGVKVLTLKLKRKDPSKSPSNAKEAKSGVAAAEDQS